MGVIVAVQVFNKNGFKQNLKAFEKVLQKLAQTGLNISIKETSFRRT